MEESSFPNDRQPWSDAFARALETQRTRVREFLTAQHDRISRAEGELATQIEAIAEQLRARWDEMLQAREELAERARQLHVQGQSLRELKSEIEARQLQAAQLHDQASRQQQALVEQLGLQQQEIERRTAQMVVRQAEIDRREAELRAEAERQFAVLGERQTELEQLHAAVERRQDELAVQRAALHSQADELHRLKAELDARETAVGERQGALDALIAETGQQQELLERQRREQEIQREQLVALQSFLEAQTAELELTRSMATQAPASAAPAAWAAERDELRRRLAEMEEHLSRAELLAAEAVTAPAGDTDLRRRYELAMDDVRELKAQNLELEKKLKAAASPTATPARPTPAAVLDWETEKLRILAALEAEGEPEDGEQTRQRLRIEEVVRQTDRVVAEKDREIAELEQLLQQQSANVGNVAVGAAALGAIFDQDALIQEERENLRRLQEQWRDKLREAEVEISIERAKMARQRTELEEKIRVFESQGGGSSAGQSSTASDKPARGRWFARLGLKDDD